MWEYRVYRAEKSGYRVLIRTLRGLLTPEEYLVRQKPATAGKRRKSKVAV